jgi:hypothetical protein
MAGGGKDGPFVNRTPEQLAQKVRETEEDTAVKTFETELSGLLNGLLASANSRDVELVKDRLGVIKGALSGRLEKTIDSLFGGSVARHTYVDGLSDVDSLLILNETALEGVTPAKAIEKIADIIKGAVGDEARVSTGKLAVTLEYKDGQQLQLLPAFRVENKLKVPSFRYDGWSGISPESFQNALSSTNDACGGKLVPTIKLAKAVIGTLPESQRLTGYHVESLAIAAFRNYQGPKTTAAMLPIFFERAREMVAKPIKDTTGQSIHVDDYLGPEDSAQRIAASHVLSRIGKRMRNASAHMSKDQWDSLFAMNDD